MKMSQRQATLAPAPIELFDQHRTETIHGRISSLTDNPALTYVPAKLEIPKKRKGVEQVLRWSKTKDRVEIERLWSLAKYRDCPSTLPFLPLPIDALVYRAVYEPEALIIQDSRYNMDHLCEHENWINVGKGGGLVVFSVDADSIVWMESLYMTQATDNRLRGLGDVSHALFPTACQVEKKKYNRSWYNQQTWDNEQRRRERYRGMNFVNGFTTVTNYRDGKNGHRTPGPCIMIIDRRKLKKACPYEYVDNKIALYTTMHILESQYAPPLGDYRKTLAETSEKRPTVFAGWYDPRLSATCIGGSVGFAVDMHNDSSRKGTPETVFWSRGRSRPSGKYAFVISDLRIGYNLDDNENSLLIMRGDLTHGSANAGYPHQDHDSIGFVIMSKKHMTSGTDWLKDQYKQIEEVDHGLRTVRDSLPLENRKYVPNQVRKDKHKVNRHVDDDDDDSE